MPFDFFAGAVVNPFKVREPDLLMQFYKLQLKVAAGARYIITQLGYNLRKLYELKQYMVREGIGHIPVLANVYVPTGKIGRMMQAGEIAVAWSRMNSSSAWKERRNRKGWNAPP